MTLSITRVKLSNTLYHMLHSILDSCTCMTRLDGDLGVEILFHLCLEDDALLAITANRINVYNITLLGQGKHDWVEREGIY